MRLFPAICVLVLLWSCEKNQTKESISFESDFFESEILCLNAGNDVNNGIVQLYFGKTNEVVDLIFTSGLGINKLFKFDSEVTAINGGLNKYQIIMTISGKEYDDENAIKGDV